MAGSVGDPSIPLTYEDFLAKLGAKDRANAEKRAGAIAAGEPAKLSLWKRTCARLMTLAGHSAKVNSKEFIQFYAADGKYRTQVFAMQEIEPGVLTIHTRDVLDALLEKKILLKSKTTDAPNHYRLPKTDDTLVVERVLAQVAEHPVAFRDLLSWNRKCMRIDIPLGASSEMLTQVDRVFELSAKSA